MHNDTRTRNKYFDHSNIANYLTGYADAVHKALMSVDHHQLQDAIEDFKITRELSGRVFVGGNGGSAAIADHFTCDHVKGCHPINLNVHSLNGSMALHSAIANDMGYDKTPVFQLQAYGLGLDDIVVLVSSSGNSPNIIEAARFANERSAVLIGMTGFDGGKLKELADVKLHVNSNNYGVIEDCHQILMHILAQFRYVVVNG